MSKSRESQVFEIIRQIVCGECPIQNRPDCDTHAPRCIALYRQEARAIYLRIVRPLEQAVID